MSNLIKRIAQNLRKAQSGKEKKSPVDQVFEEIYDFYLLKELRNASPQELLDRSYEGITPDNVGELHRKIKEWWVKNPEGYPDDTEQSSSRSGIPNPEVAQKIEEAVSQGKLFSVVYRERDSREEHIFLVIASSKQDAISKVEYTFSDMLVNVRKGFTQTQDEFWAEDYSADQLKELVNGNAIYNGSGT
jgi:hypothetical protein